MIKRFIRFVMTNIFTHGGKTCHSFTSVSYACNRYTAVFVPLCRSVNAPAAMSGVSQRERQKLSVFFLLTLITQ